MVGICVLRRPCHRRLRCRSSRYHVGRSRRLRRRSTGNKPTDWWGHRLSGSGSTTRYWRRRAWILKTAFVILWEPRARWRRVSLGPRCVCSGLMMSIGVVELVPDFVISASVFLVESHNVDHGLRVLLLLLLGDTVLLQESLPFFRQAGELASLIVVAHVGDMNRVFGGGDLDAPRRP